MTDPKSIRTGTVHRYQSAKPGEPLGHYVVRCSAPDGSRPVFHLEPSLESAAERRKAKKIAGEITEGLWREGLGSARSDDDVGAAMSDWVERWEQERYARGLSTTSDNVGHYTNHIAPTLEKHVRDWTKDDLRALSRALDAKVSGGEISWKTAVNVWGTASKFCDDATNSKHDDLRCRAGENPFEGIRGPERGAQKAQQILYPDEVDKIVRCGSTPLAWRQLIAMSVYSYLRDQELRALECEDIDLDHGIIEVSKAWNRRTGKVEATKGNRLRRVPIEPALRPLLEHLTAGRKGPIFDFPSYRDMARGLRREALRAGVKRRALHEESPTSRKLKFHDLRATGITWKAIRGDGEIEIRAHAGHEDFETTKEYLRMALVIRTQFGEPFAPLPASLYGGQEDDSLGLEQHFEFPTANNEKAAYEGHSFAAFGGYFPCDNALSHHCHRASESSMFSGGADGTRSRLKTRFHEKTARKTKAHRMTTRVLTELSYRNPRGARMRAQRRKLTLTLSPIA